MPHLRKLAKLAIPAAALVLGAAALDTRAQDRVAIDVPVRYTVQDSRDAIGTFVGMPVHDESGAPYGIVSEVIVDGASALAVVTRGDGSLAEVPLGDAETVVAQIPAPVAADDLVTTFIVPEYRTPESRGS